MKAVMGIDGGGTTVRAALYRADDLSPLGRGEAPGANPNVAGRAAAAAHIGAAVAAALHAAGVDAGAVAAVGAGVAGTRHPELRAWVTGVLAELLPGARVVASTDYEIALAGAHGRRQGSLLLAGTGALAYGVNAAGESHLAGGWGYLLGDEGGGGWLGAAALRAVVRAVDGRGRETALVDAALGALGIADPYDLIPWLYGGEAPARALAGLAPLALSCAEAGDPVARSLVDAAAAELALAARAVRVRLGPTAAAVAFTGGLLTAPNPLSAAVCARLGLAEIPLPQFDAVTGAALLARESPS